MDSGEYPSLNSLMFGGGARWPGTDPDEYRPFDSNTQYDPEFSTDSYGLSDMEPSPTRPAAPSRRTTVPSAAPTPARKKRNRHWAYKLQPPETNEEYAPGRTNYQPDETVVLARCWVNISEDPVFANNQKQVAYCELITERYNEAKPPSAYKRHREQLRKHWDQVKKQVNLFSAKYEKCLRDQGSGESLSDVRDRALLSYQSLYGDFKHFNIWVGLAIFDTTR